MARKIAERSDIVPLLAEAFRENGFEGASLTLIGAKTGLGKGSLYHFFPGGKEEMAEAVLADIESWFEAHVYRPLRETEDAAQAVGDMRQSVEAYFRSGRRACLIGAFALDNVRDRFSAKIRNYFAAWTEALAGALERGGVDPKEVPYRAEEAVANIQGALVLARALDDPAVFERAMARIEARLLAG
ncbi:transcriptional regulator, TetR family [Methylocella silvestris BL2]|uniref:Transcriptional regulator, TetR family n=1 Tax=Methylocella silvestris (strain DSM 15510 / CIP 108128 / LMG 27833 / NCIMB 13906 / BL2) TaxID=395965 RepID=B8ERM1_METSB|nr:TetR/AcrR family transcriptional regulator [Methylocella silvestris]ACK51073.1 transcriptional regulator, TetR family [Methylocella silvestris BL2]